ncbi:MAG: NUDIX domain-containing protein [Candidatus Aenigmatarchaeota archaeon]
MIIFSRSKNIPEKTKGFHPRIHHKIAGIIIKNKKLLMCRKYDEEHFIIPGGRPKASESVEQTLARELKEELDVELASMKFFKTYEAPHFKDKDTLVSMDTFFVDIKGIPKASQEINELIWLGSSYKNKGIKVASINEDFLIPDLKKAGLID